MELEGQTRGIETDGSNAGWMKDNVGERGCSPNGARETTAVDGAQRSAHVKGGDADKGGDRKTGQACDERGEKFGEGRTEICRIKQPKELRLNISAVINESFRPGCTFQIVQAHLLSSSRIDKSRLRISPCLLYTNLQRNFYRLPWRQWSRFRRCRRKQIQGKVMMAHAAQLPAGLDAAVPVMSAPPKPLTPLLPLITTTAVAVAKYQTEQRWSTHRVPRQPIAHPKTSSVEQNQFPDILPEKVNDPSRTRALASAQTVYSARESVDRPPPLPKSLRTLQQPTWKPNPHWVIALRSRQHQSKTHHPRTERLELGPAAKMGWCVTGEDGKLAIIIPPPGEGAGKGGRKAAGSAKMKGGVPRETYTAHFWRPRSVAGGLGGFTLARLRVGSRLAACFG